MVLKRAEKLPDCHEEIPKKLKEFILRFYKNVNLILTHNYLFYARI